MSDPATGLQIGVSTLAELTRLVAAHGVYALTILAIFILQRRAAASLRRATTRNDKEYFRRHYNWATALAYGLTLIATGVWFYGNFLHRATCVVQGSIRGLEDQTITPQSPDDPPFRVHRVGNYRRDVDFYYNKEAEEGLQGYVLDWALVASARKEVYLTFQQQVRTWSESGRFDLTGLGGPPRSQLVSRTVSGVFKLDIDDPRKLEGTRVHLQYTPDPEDPDGKLGTLKRVEGAGFQPIPWLDETETGRPDSVSARRAPGFGLAAAAWAWPAAQVETRTARSEPTERAKQWRLLSLLGSGELSDQLLGKKLLLHQGAGAPALMEWLLDEEDTRGYDRELLVYNLSAVVSELERAGHPPPPEIRKRLADELWYLRDPAAAAPLYESLTYKELTSEWDLYKKGVSLFETGRFELAIPPLERFLEDPDRSAGAEAPARYALGCAYAKTLRTREAVIQLERVLELGVTEPGVRYALGKVYLDQGRYERAQEVLSVDLYPEDVPLRVALAGALAKQGDRERAAHIFEELVAFGERDPVHLEYLAHLYSDVGAEPDNAARLRAEAEEVRGRKPKP